MNTRRLLAATVVAVCVMGLPAHDTDTTTAQTRIQAIGNALSPTASTATAGPARRAARRTARRTARRVTRRHTYYNALPGGCVRRTIAGTLYWRCGNVFYQPLVDNGKTVYVIVTP